MEIQQIHHVAYRCHDVKQTVEFYQRVLNMDFLLAISEDRVPSTGEHSPYMHVFLDAGHGNILAFFELPQSPTMGKDPNTPAWVQHIAFQLADEDALMTAKQDIEAHGIEVLGPTDHGIIKSIYFFDPNGHRLELTTNTATAEMMQELRQLAPVMMEEWVDHQHVETQASFMHVEHFDYVTLTKRQGERLRKQ